MERSNLSSNVGKIKEKWKYSSGFTASSENVVPFEASCVARNVYTCSFCIRRFKSAQALGGHMNVHRRERARLRLLPNPNPSPSMASSVLSSPTPFSTKHVPCNANPFAMASTDHKDKKKLIVFDFDHVTVDNNRIFKVFKTENNGVRLDLEMSLFEDSKDDQDVDLELRLGYL